MKTAGSVAAIALGVLLLAEVPCGAISQDLVISVEPDGVAVGKGQYRVGPKDLEDNHIHVEELDPETGEVKQNLHLRWKEEEEVIIK